MVRSELPVRILVVDDEESYLDALSTALRREGFDVDLADNGSLALKAFEASPPDLVLLDLLLPGISGIDLFRRMRDLAPVPVIMVSALDGEVDVVLGLEMGAEDYVTKPFLLRELLARINAVLRRFTSPLGAIGPPEKSLESGAVFSAGPVVLDQGRRKVTKDGREVQLSRREFDLLALLLNPPGQVRSRTELIDVLWSGRVLSDTRTLDTHVRRLRIKLEDDRADPRLLVTVRGIGFRIDAEAASTDGISPLR
jgi:two-component system response regulator RegX3